MRNLENVKTKIIKPREGIKFIKTCKQEKLIPTFSNVKIAITENIKQKKKTAHLVLETELQNKHFDKQKLKK